MNQTIFLYLLLSAMPACAGVFALSKGKERWAILLLMLSAFLMRFVLVCSDSYLYEWDEKFHALVAKNMMDEPFKPMLKTAAVFQFQLTDWCCNHIWLHKQPLFLWIMALSMKVFGINVIAMRLPSVLYATINVFFIYEIAAYGIINTIPLFFSSFSQKVRRNVTAIIVLAAIIVGWNPYGISSFRSDSNEWRNNKISNNQIYQNLRSFDSNELLINCKTFEDIDIMFYNDVLASHWYPPIEELDSLYRAGYTFSAFDDHGQHGLPPYIKNDTLIRIIKNDIR